jgi:hypothetical protein
VSFLPGLVHADVRQELSGVFAMRIYDAEHSVGQILENCSVEVRNGEDPPPGVVHGIDLARLNERLRTINVKEIRRRRARLNTFTQEVFVAADPERGISFSSCLIILTHYNVISDSKSLRLEEFLRRRYRLQLVEEEINRRIVIGFFDTLFWSRQFHRRKELRHSARMTAVPQFAVPEIFVDDQDAPEAPSGPPSPTSPFPALSHSRHSSSHGPLNTTHEGIQQGFGLGIHRGAGSRGAGARPRGESFGSSPSRSESSYGPSPTLRPRRPSDQDSSTGDAGFALDGPASGQNSGGRPSFERRGSGGRAGADDAAPSSVTTGMQAQPGGAHRRQQSSVGSTQREFALEVFDNSAWGESIKRSFTLRRNVTRGRGRFGRGDP